MWRTVYQDLANRYNIEPNQPVSALRAQLERLKVRTFRVPVFDFLLLLLFNVFFSPARSIYVRVQIIRMPLRMCVLKQAAPDCALDFILIYCIHQK